MTKIQDLRQLAHTIKNEKKVGGNTADRVGSAFEGVADALEGTEQIAEMDKAVQEVQQQVEASKAQIQSLVNALPVVQQTGDSTTSVMSQKAVTDAIQTEIDRATKAEQAIIYDVSSHNNGAVFESLQALLSSSDLNTLIPTSARTGGITIRFIQGSVPNSDNKYVQYRLTKNQWSTTIADWQGVDDVPTAGSDNLVKSGGITKSLADLTFSPCTELSIYAIAKGWKLHGDNGLCVQNENYKLVKYKVEENKVLKLNLQKDGDVVYQFQSNERIPSTGTNTDLIGLPNKKGGLSMVKVPVSATYLIVSALITTTSNYIGKLAELDDAPTNGSDNLVKSGGVKNELSKLNDDISKLNDDIGNVVELDILYPTHGYQGFFCAFNFVRGNKYIVTNNGTNFNTLYLTTDISEDGGRVQKISWSTEFVCEYDNVVGVNGYLNSAEADGDVFVKCVGLKQDFSSIKTYLDSDGYVTNSKLADNAVTNSKLADNAVTSRNVNINILPNSIIAATVTPNVNTQYGYISFGTRAEALYVTTVKGKIIIEGDSYKTDGEYRAYFKDGTTKTASSIIFIYIDTINKKFVPRGQDAAFMDTQSRYILLGSVVCAYTPDGSYKPNSFRRASFPFEYTVNGSSLGDDINSMTSYTPYGTDILTLNPSNEILPILKNFKHRIRNLSFVEQVKQLVLLQLTDQHGDKTRMNRAMQFASKYGEYIDDVIHTGDLVNDNWANGIDWFANVQNKNNILQVIGNHDVYLKAGSDGKIYTDPNNLSQYIEKIGVFLNKTTYKVLGYKNSDNEMVWVNYTDIYGRYIAPYVSNWGVVQPSNAALEGLNYYYKDYTEQGIRLIVLDCMMYDTAQNTWLISVLTDAKTNGYGVIIAEHYPIQLDGFEYCAFTSSGNNDVLDFYQSLGSASTLTDAQLAVDNFMNDGGEFICWLAGHTHMDVCGTLKNYPKQVMIVSDITGLYSLEWGDEVRTVGTKTEDCFSIISIDRYKKIVRLYRVGNQWDRYGRHKVSMAFDYRAAKMIYSS